MSKQTAVEWLEEQFKRQRFIEHIDFEQAKAMEREQIEDAYYDGQSLNAKSVTSQMIIDNSISYYNEIYKGGEQ
jgi:hypothetical protein